jgi:hypothetical protein
MKRYFIFLLFLFLPIASLSNDNVNLRCTYNETWETTVYNYARSELSKNSSSNENKYKVASPNIAYISIISDDNGYFKFERKVGAFVEVYSSKKSENKYGLFKNVNFEIENLSDRNQFILFVKVRYRDYYEGQILDRHARFDIKIDRISGRYSNNVFDDFAISIPTELDETVGVLQEITDTSTDHTGSCEKFVRKF